MDDKSQKEGGFSINPKGIKCFPCRFRKNSYKRNKKKIINKEGIITVEENLDTSSIGFGRGTTPPTQLRTLTLEEKIERLETKLEEIKIKQINDIDTGFRKAISLDERLLKLEKELEALKKSNGLNGLD